VARIAFLIKNPKRALGSLALLVAATGVVIGSGANFSASSANPTNQFSAGTLTILNSKEGVAVFTSGTGLKPGGPSVVGTTDIQNTGSLPGTFTLTRSAPQDSDTGNPLSGKLNLVVKDCGVWTNSSTPNVCGDGDDTTKYGASTATLAAMSSPVALGTFAAGEKHRYEFTVSLDASASDAYQGDSTQTDFTWNAVQ
jgi:spore coat-associated protein N